MKRFDVVFYYKGNPSYKGDFELEADDENIADKMVEFMINTKSDLIPDNWDYWKVSAYD